IINLSEAECSTEQAFVAALGRARTRAFSPFWRGSVDVRLISVPTERTVTRVALRIVNKSPAAQSDFLVANLYGVRLSIDVPKDVHRPTIFQELPASFRYDRRMPGVGINAHVRDEELGSLLRLVVESVPITETPRLEAREFSDAVPTFSS